MTVWVLNYYSSWVCCLETVEEEESLVRSLWSEEFVISICCLYVMAMSMIIMVIVVIVVVTVTR